MLAFRKSQRILSLLAVPVLCIIAASSVRGATRGADSLYWCPTFDQALEMAQHTGKPIFMMFYTNVEGGCPTFSGDGVVL
jgi:hypothetical protein